MAVLSHAWKCDMYTHMSLDPEFHFWEFNLRIRYQDVQEGSPQCYVKGLQLSFKKA